MTDLSPEAAFQIDFNFHQVPSALSLDIPDEAAALMLKLEPAQFAAYAAEAYAECVRVAGDLLQDPATTEAIRRLKTPRTGAVSTVLTVGDSITTYRYGYAEILRVLLALVDAETPVQFDNHGRSGYTSTHGLEHTFTQYRLQKPDWVFLKYGANDTKRFGGERGKLLVSLEEYTANMAGIVDAFLSIGARVVLLTPTPVVEALVNNNPDFQAMRMTWNNADLQACASAIRQIAATRRLPLVDLYSIFSANPDPALYVPDGLHPGPAGHRLMIEQVLNAVRASAP